MKRFRSLLDIFRRSKLGFDFSLEDLVLLAIFIAQEKGLPITETRLHKVVTIVERELNLGIANPQPHYFGPYVPELKEVLEELARKGLIESETREREYSEFGYPYIKIYKVTNEGAKRAREVMEKLKATSLGRSILKLIELWAPQKLDIVLYHVYRKYPDLTDRSVIKDKVLELH